MSHAEEKWENHTEEQGSHDSPLEMRKSEFRRASLSLMVS